MKQKNIVSSLALLAVVAVGMPSATAADLAGWYAGAGIGLAQAPGGCDGGSIPGVTFTSCTDDDTGWKAFMGYQFTANWGAEVAYVNFAKPVRGAAIVTGAPVTLDAEASGWQLAGVGTIPVNDQFSVFGKLGVFRSDVDITVASAGVSMLVSGNHTDLTYGIGASWDFTRNVRAQLEAQRFDNVGDKNTTGEQDINFYTLNLVIRF